MLIIILKLKIIVGLNSLNLMNMDWKTLGINLPTTIVQKCFNDYLKPINFMRNMI